jgi:dihydrofolate reductase
MRKLHVTQFISLDGVIQGPSDPNEDTEGGFTQGGWLMPFWHDDLGELLYKNLSTRSTLLLGRKTWQMHAEAFSSRPLGEDRFADLLNSQQKYVVSSTLTLADVWADSTVIRSDVVSEVQKLKGKNGADIHVDGSSVLLHTLIANELVDEYFLFVAPVVLGSGKRLFPENHRVNLGLVELHTYPTGLVFMHYVSSRT